VWENVTTLYWVFNQLLGRTTKCHPWDEGNEMVPSGIKPNKTLVVTIVLNLLPRFKYEKGNGSKNFLGLKYTPQLWESARK
jgi:hypothetical protein